METYEIQDLTEAGKEILIIESMRAAGEDVASYYEIMGNAGWIEFKYKSYMTTEPVNVNKELKRLPSADFHLCCVLLTMLLREDHFSNGSFKYRIADGSVDRILSRMITLQTR